MSTRSCIGYEHDDGCITGVYCHWNGYIDGVGRTLLEHFADRDETLRLVAGGDISSLGVGIGQQHDFDVPLAGVTTYYGRDRGEAGVECRHFSSREPFVQHYCRMGAEYAYLLTLEGQWLVCSREPQFFGGSDGSPMNAWQPLVAQLPSALVSAQVGLP